MGATVPLDMSRRAPVISPWETLFVTKSGRFYSCQFIRWNNSLGFVFVHNLFNDSFKVFFIGVFK